VGGSIGECRVIGTEFKFNGIVAVLLVELGELDVAEIECGVEWFVGVVE